MNGANLTLTQGADSTTNDTITWTNAPTAGFATTNFSKDVNSGQIVINGTTYTVTSIGGTNDNVLTLSTKQVITSTTLSGVSMHQAATTATFDENVIALTPAKDAITASLTISNGNQITRSGGDWSDASFSAGSEISLRGTSQDDGTYVIHSISGSTITLCTSNCEFGATAAGSLANDSASPGTVALISSTNTVTTSLSITSTQLTRTDGHNWFDAGFSVGSVISVNGTGTSSNDATYKIASITGSTITLCASSCGSGIAAANLHVATANVTLTLVPGHATGSDTHSFIDVRDLPIAVMTGSSATGVLQDGGVYRVVNVSGSGVERDASSSPTPAATCSRSARRSTTRSPASGSPPASRATASS